jgi:hypothetical protein
VSTDLLRTKTTTPDELRPLAEAGVLCAVLDACDVFAVPGKIDDLAPGRGLCVYTGQAAEDMRYTAPYLARVDGELLDWIVATLWHQPWGLFLLTTAPLAELRVHFKRLTYVELADGERVYFRYYDPRVLATFLEIATAEQLDQLFGPIHTFIVAGSGLAGEEIRAFARRADEPSTQPPRPLRIRPEQMPPFERVVQQVYEHRLVAHLHEHFPDECDTLGDDGVRDSIRHAIGRATAHRIDNQHDVCQYLNLMYVFGRDFDVDPGLPWAGEVLTDDQVDPAEKMDKLYAVATDHAEEGEGIGKRPAP